MSRTSARKHAFILAFQTEFHPKELYEEIVEKYLTPFESMSTEDRRFVMDEFQGVTSNKEELDGIIGKYSSGWSVDRLSKVDLSILRLSIYEILYSHDVPPRVSINEAVELAKMFSGDDAPSFINGILGNVLKEREANI